MANTYYFVRSSQPGGVGSASNPFRVPEGTEGDDMKTVIETGITAIEDAMGDTPNSEFVFGDPNAANGRTGRGFRVSRVTRAVRT